MEPLDTLKGWISESIQEVHWNELATCFFVEESPNSENGARGLGQRDMFLTGRGLPHHRRF